MKPKALLLMVLALAAHTVTHAEFETSFKQKTEQQYRDAAKTKGTKIVKELSGISQSSIASQMQHMNTYEKAKYVQKINSYYGTNYSVDELTGAGKSYADQMRLSVENNSRATVVEHAADVAKMQTSASNAFGQDTAPNGMNAQTYERMVQTQNAATKSGVVGMDYAKEVMKSNSNVLNGGLDSLKVK